MNLISGIVEGEVFEQIILPPYGESSTVVEDTTLKNCRTHPGTCRIKEGTRLKNVTFDSFDCGDAIHIEAEAQFQEVVFKGKKPSMIWLKPKGDAQPNRRLCIRQDAEWAIDISDFHGDVSITGLSIEQIRYNPKIQVAIDLDVTDKVNFKELGIGGLSYWKICIGKLSGGGSKEGIFSIPSPKTKRYEQIIEQLNLLREKGIVA